MWSILSPMMMMAMSIVFTQLFGRNTPHFAICLFSGNSLFCCFSEATRGGMYALIGNARILSKVNVSKYLFVIFNNLKTMISFLLALIVCFTE